MNHHLPLHEHLKQNIIHAIARGEYKPNEKLPSQRKLCDLYDMSHMTVRRALNELVNEGVIYAIPGKGTFIAEDRRVVEFDSLVGLSGQLARLGMKPETKVLEARVTAASAALERLLEIAHGSPVVYLHRVRFADEKPMALTTCYLPHDLCPGFLEHEGATDDLFDTLRRVYDLKLVGSRNTVFAELANEETRTLLNLEHPTAILVREQITYLSTGRPIEFSRTVTASDLHLVQFEEGTVPKQ